MFQQLTTTVYDSLNKWHFKCPMWSLNLNLEFKPTPFKSLLVLLAQITSYCHVIIMHHNCCIALIVFLPVCRYFPPSVDVVPTMSSMTPMKNYIIFRSARQAKPPCSFQYNPTLSLLLSFTALGQQRFNCYMLR